MITRKYTVSDVVSQNTLTISETSYPQALALSVFDAQFSYSTEIIISRADWEALLTHLSKYSTGFTWAPSEPDQPAVS